MLPYLKDLCRLIEIIIINLTHSKKRNVCLRDLAYRESNKGALRSADLADQT